LLEAHESALRGLALTADGTKLATASVKGTVIRVWDVASSSCLQEFRRGVERATITCLAWSWDAAWLSCTSDKGTAHIFQVENNKQQEEEKKKKKSSAETTSSSLTQMLYKSVRKSVVGEAKNSVCQVRGVPHPRACSFVADATNLLAVAGYDADGNGVLLLAEFTPNEEPRRVGYHVLCRSETVRNESEEARRRRRMRGWTPEIPQTPEGGRLYVGERLEILEQGMERIRFDEDRDDGFVSVSTVRPVAETKPAAAADRDEEGPSKKPAEQDDGSTHVVNNGDGAGDSQNTDESRSNRDSLTVGDSVRTEPLDDTPDNSNNSESAS
jgi:WD40 repeat protein